MHFKRSEYFFQSVGGRVSERLTRTAIWVVPHTSGRHLAASRTECQLPLGAEGLTIRTNCLFKRDSRKQDGITRLFDINSLIQQEAETTYERPMLRQWQEKGVFAAQNPVPTTGLWSPYKG